ncbi:DUF4286 family protein [Mucilaginibacter sp. SP1R1]|uniref:DUF4286 family protein n=1 Tax=Mucilaginibacter sp. SP1R1 TaxID=2723091 RepID=UPI001607EB51|nr:DUF4286 family protein [Mucilaginibacter sp. SP1R1]MBB6150822.1 hypothetical protein [Mucilaginibacter sp. SP1R1]
MIVYNDTIIIEETIQEEWLNWIKTVHIPAVMATGCFSSYKILTVVDSPNEGVTYCIQYNADNMEQFQQFYMNHLYKFRSIHQERFDEKFVMFNTLMKEVE